MPKIKISVSGEVGSGKSTLICWVVDVLRKQGANVVMPSDSRNFDIQKVDFLGIDWSKFDIEFEETR